LNVFYDFMDKTEKEDDDAQILVLITLLNASISWRANLIIILLILFFRTAFCFQILFP
jgi:hypothetical protein